MVGELDPQSAIAIVGMSGRFPGASNPEAFWSNLKNGVCSISFFQPEELLRMGIPERLVKNPSYVPAMGYLDGIDQFDPGFFGISPREAELMDPQHRIMLLLAWEAFENAGYDPWALDQAVGVYAGITANTYKDRNIMASPGVARRTMGRQIRMFNDREFLPTFISYKLNLRGPSLNVQTACSTSLVAVHYACQGLLYGECDMALAGGAALGVPAKTGYLYREGLIHAPDGVCRAFDAQARGTVFGRGAGVVLLKRLEDALADRDVIHAIIRGTAVNNDGARKLGYSAPSVEGQAEAIAAALMVGNVDPEDVGYVEAHGTGTALGDPVEVASLTKAFGSVKRKQYCGLGSVKTNIGHLDAAAGIASLIKAVATLKHRLLPPSLNFENANPKINFAESPFYVNRALKPWVSTGCRLAGVNSFGIGGTNAHVVLQEPPRFDGSLCQSPQLFCLSGRSETSLRKTAGILAKQLRSEPDLSPADVGFSLSGRHGFNHRLALVCRNLKDATAQLEEAARGRITLRQSNSSLRIIFMFPGQGTQFRGMGLGLLEVGTVFRQCMDNCREILKGKGLDLFGFLEDTHAGPENLDPLHRTENAQVALFSVSYGLSRQLVAWGVQPHGLLGHSLGELTAACLAGVFSLEDGLNLVWERGKLMQAMPPGKMLAVPLGASDLEPHLRDGVVLAAVNAPDRCVLSGPSQSITSLAARLELKGVPTHLIKVSHGFHSPMMAPVADRLRALFQGVPLNEPSLPIISNLNGAWLSSADARDPNYWARQMLNPVLFSAGLKQAANQGETLFLEIGPGQILCDLARRQHIRTCIPILGRPSKGNDGLQQTYRALGEVWSLQGTSLHQALYAAGHYRRVALSSSPFDLQSYWIEGAKEQRNPETVDGTGKEIKKPDLADWCYLPVWRKTNHLPVASSFGLWVLFADSSDLGKPLAEALSGNHCEAILVTPGSDFVQWSNTRFQLRPGQPNDYERLFQALEQSRLVPDVYLHAWNLSTLDPQSEKPLESEQDAALTLRFYSLFYLAQILAARKSLSRRPCRILVLGEGSRLVNPGDRPDPWGALAHGSVRIIGQELQPVRCNHLDLEAGWQAEINEDWIHRIIAEGLEQNPDLHLAYRGGQRFVLDYKPTRLQDTPDSLKRLKPGGPYLVTGGLGGIGLKMAEFLAGRCGGNIVLTTRRPVPERHPDRGWGVLEDPCFAAEYGLDPKNLRELRRDLERIESLGAVLWVKTADAADPVVMKNLFQWAHLKWGGFHGVINAAGVADGGMIWNRDKASIKAVFAAKVVGSAILDRLISQYPVTFLAHMSTLHAVVGGIGKLAHSAASAFMDGLAQASRGRQFSVNWDAWLQVGQAAAAHRRSEKKILPGQPFHHPLFRKVSRQANTTTLTTELNASRDWVVSEHIIDGKPVLPGTAYWSLICQALRLENVDSGISLENLVLTKPMVFQTGETREISVVLQMEGNRGSFSVSSRSQGQTSSENHVTGNLSIAGEKETKRFCSIELARDLPEERRVVGRKKQKQRGFFQHGPRWGTLQWMKWSANKGLAFLELPERHWSDRNAFDPHPAQLDTALGFLAKTRVEGAFLPFACDKLTVFKPMPSRIYAFARVLDARSNNRSLVQDVVVFDEEGCPCVQVDGFVLRKVGHGREQEDRGKCGFQLTVRPGHLDSLRLTPKPGPPEPGMGQVQIEVKAVGLNFKDVLKALGMLGGSRKKGPELGMECSGIVTRVGKGVKGICKGDSVLAFASAAFQPLISLPASQVFPIPGSMTWEQAATVPVAFLTAHYALVYVARLSRGEAVLIHCATGGVGLAALQVARSVGARVFASAGSETKRRYLRDLGVEQVVDSRNPGFAKHILKWTGGRGVDVVLNSLEGEMQREGLSALAPFGRFLELGRKDIVARRSLDLHLLKKNISFSVITASPAMPAFRRTVQSIMRRFEKGQYQPLPAEVLALSKVKDAFSQMAAARHIGKLVLTLDPGGKAPLLEPAKSPLRGRSGSKERHGMTPEEGVEVFRRILASGHAQVVVSTRTLDWVARGQDRRISKVKNKPMEILHPKTLDEKGVKAKMARVWCDFLGLEKVNVQDDFFELGGDSLTAVQLVSMINRTLKTDFSPYALLDSPTIEALALRYQEKAENNKSTRTREVETVDLNAAHGDAPALYLLPALDGSLFHYRNLATELGPAIRVVGLRDQSPPEGDTKTSSVTAMAAIYAEKIRNLEESGPICVGGHSFGGLVALEVVRCLSGSGQSPLRVLLIDSYLPGQMTYQFEDDASVIAFWLAGQLNFTQTAKTLRGMDADQQIAFYCQTLKLPMPTQKGAFYERVRRFRHQAQLMKAHEVRPFHGQAVYFKADQKLDGFPQHRRSEWDRLLIQAQWQTTPGHHLNLLEGPHAITLGNRILTQLNQNL